MTDFRPKSQTSSAASKLFGCLTFLTTGCYGKLGRAGLNALKERQYTTETLVDGVMEDARVTNDPAG